MLMSDQKQSVSLTWEALRLRPVTKGEETGRRNGLISAPATQV